MSEQTLQPQAGKQGPALRPGKGLGFALLFGLAGPLAAVALSLAFLAIRWWRTEASPWDRSNDLRSLPFMLTDALIVISLVFSAAGWATFAPRGENRFVRTLAIVFAVSFPLWFVLGTAYEASGLAPHAHKGEPTPPLGQLVGFVLMAIPPFGTAGVLSAVRASGHRKRRVLDDF
jgi:hypothetical protein